MKTGNQRFGGGGGKRAASQPRTPVIGLEAEFTLFVRDEKKLPEHVFRNPQAIVRERMVPREGKSFHLPSGGAIYFDTGVIEVATPIIEIERGCCARAVRSLWEQISYLRGELDAWEKRHGARVRLQGFSAHYNISVPASCGLDPDGVRAASRLLTYILPVPAMILAANRLSTGIGVRPRDGRIEVTADFTPDPDLMIAATSLIVGVVLGVLRWPAHGFSMLKKKSVPVVAGFSPRRHTSRKGWLARSERFPRNPFTADINARDWLLRDGRTVSLREMAREIAASFRREIRRVSDAASCAHISEVFDGTARSLLDFEDRPPRYDDVARVMDWNRRSLRTLPRSAYEKVIQRVITHRKLRVGATTWLPERMQGWYEIVFRHAKTGRRRVFNLDELVKYCG